MKYEVKKDLIIAESEIVSAEFKNLVGYKTEFLGQRYDYFKEDGYFDTYSDRMQNLLKLLREKGDCCWYQIIEYKEGGYDVWMTAEEMKKRPDFNTLAKKSSEYFAEPFNVSTVKKLYSFLTRYNLQERLYAHYLSEYFEYPIELTESFKKHVYEAVENLEGYEKDDAPEILKMVYYDRDRMFERHLEMYVPIKNK